MGISEKNRIIITLKGNSVLDYGNINRIFKLGLKIMMKVRE
jgi:hypothetical protein